MTARARRLLAALEAGCSSRDEIFAHQGRFSLLNNAAAELRAAGVPVECVVVDGDYRYLLDERHGINPPSSPVALVEQDGGQLGWDVAA